MHRTLVVFVALSLVACATTPSPTPVATAPAATQAAAPATPQCNPGHTLVNAALWVGSSAEYQAAALSTFSAARRGLDAALADPTWTGTEEENANDPAQPPAIILDLDETAIDNIEFEVRAMRTGQTYDAELWKQWVSEGAAKAVPGAAEFLAYAKSRGVTPFYITNRDFPAEEAGTRANLEGKRLRTAARVRGEVVSRAAAGRR
jgi:acid phosphatase